MKGLEAALERIATKDELHRWIDEQDEDARFLIMVEERDDEGYGFFSVGSLRTAEVVYMCELLKAEMLMPDEGEG